MRRGLSLIKSAACMLGTLLISWASLAAADTVFLRTGEVLHGRVLRATEEEVSIQLDSGGILSFRAGRVGTNHPFDLASNMSGSLLY